MSDLISRSELKKAIMNDLGLGDEENGSDAEYMSGLYDCYNIIDKAPTVEPCYQTTSCSDCANYDKENHNCPRFCEVIKSAIEEGKE